MEGFCRGCLNEFDYPTSLTQYSESNRRLFVYSTGIQVKRNDIFTFQLCKDCHHTMRISCKFKKQCRNSDKKFKNYLACKDVEDSVDLQTYLKNVENTLSLRAPKLSSSSTPTHQRIRHNDNEDSDNESTCTSIQNFMTDMLEGEEMPPTEAQIIREVIQEEADIMDDSLDSHWLQDDLSVDYGINFNFTGFSTPRSVINDHCYTPVRLTEDTDEQIEYYNSRKMLNRPHETKAHQLNDMPILDDCETKFKYIATNNNISIDHRDAEYHNQNGTGPTDPQSINKERSMPVLDGCNLEIDGIVNETITATDLKNELHIENAEEKMKLRINHIAFKNKGNETNTEDDPFVRLESFQDNLFSISNDLSPFKVTTCVNAEKICNKEQNSMLSNEHDISIVLSKGIAGQKVYKSALTGEPENDIYNKAHTKCHHTLTNKTCDNVWTTEINKKKEMKKIINQGNANEIMISSHLALEQDKYINKGELNKALESNSIDEVLCQLKSNSNYIINRENSIYNSPIKRELELYINKAKIKIKSNQAGQFNADGKKCNDSIDKNLEIALKNQDSHEISLDQLLLSPQVSLKSGVSTPTINNILFGSITPNKKYTNIVSLLRDPDHLQDPNSLDFIENFLKEDEIKGQSTPKKCRDNYEIGIKVTQRNELVHHEASQNKTYFRQTRATKDIKKLKQLYVLDNEEQISENSDDESFNSSQENDENIAREKSTPNADEINGLDVSVSNLLNYDDSQSIDLNFSISSDFLKDIEKVDDVDFDCKDPINLPVSPQNDHSNADCKDPFKRPFTPTDTKYDLEKCVCKICDKKYTSEKALRIHFAKIHKFKITKSRKTIKPSALKCCHICGRTFRDKSNLNRHLKKHADPDAFRCQYCTLLFHSRGKLSQHMRAHAKELQVKKVDDEENNKTKEIKKYVCSTCGHVSKGLSNFKVHQNRHLKNYTVTCDQCGKGFYKKSDLIQHINVHFKIYRFACQYCPKRYNRRDLLMEHTYRHLGKSNFKCEICDAIFISKHLLKNHYTTKTCMKKREELAMNSKEDTKSHHAGGIVIQNTNNNIPKDITIDDEIDEDIEMISSNEEKLSRNSVTNDKESIKKTESLNVGSSEMRNNIRVEALDTVEICTELCLDVTEGYSLPKLSTPKVMDECIAENEDNPVHSLSELSTPKRLDVD